MDSEVKLGNIADNFQIKTEGLAAAVSDSEALHAALFQIRQFFQNIFRNVVGPNETIFQYVIVVIGRRSVGSHFSLIGPRRLFFVFVVLVLLPSQLVRFIRSNHGAGRVFNLLFGVVICGVVCLLYRKEVIVYRCAAAGCHKENYGAQKYQYYNCGACCLPFTHCLHPLSRSDLL